MFIGLKDAAFEHSTPLRHASEIYNILQSVSFNKTVLFIYSDGGCDHRLTFISVQLSLICLFLKLDLDYLCAGRTAPYHSWRNPVERVMSIINLGLQCVGLARAEMPDEVEKEVGKCNSLSELRRTLEGKQLAVSDSLSPVKVLLSRIFVRLKLNDRQFSVFNSATDTELSDFWSAILALDSTLTETVYRKDTFDSHERVVEFMTHCCQCSHYTFDILKCGEPSCRFCSPVRLPMDIFKKLHHIPHPMLGEDGHYRLFSEVFGTQTSEEHRPSFKQTLSSSRKAKRRRLPYYASVQHVKNSQLMVQCTECSMWRLIFSKFKLTREDRTYLQTLLEEFEYSCGASLRDLELTDKFDNVEIRDHNCHDPIEILYYSAKYEPICVHCGSDQPFSDDKEYPICSVCVSAGKQPLKKK